MSKHKRRFNDEQAGPKARQAIFAACSRAFMELISALFRTLDQLDRRMAALQSGVTLPRPGSVERQQVERLIAALGERTRKLEERQHEREVLGPVFLTLIGLLDRARNEHQLAARSAAKYDRKHHPEVSRALRQLARARDIDVIEIENALQVLGVQAYVHPGDKFNPSQQKCTERMVPTNGQLPGSVAERQRVGFRRGDTIIRPEWVTVYVAPAKEKEKSDERLGN